MHLSGPGPHTVWVLGRLAVALAVAVAVALALGLALTLALAGRDCTGRVREEAYGVTESTSASIGVSSSVVASVGRWKDNSKGRGVVLSAVKTSA